MIGGPNPENTLRIGKTSAFHSTEKYWAECNKVKKANIAISAADSRTERFVGGERIDAAIAEINFEKRKVSLSIKLLEEIMNAKAIKEHSSPLSGKNLPFSSLSEQLDGKKKNKDTE